MDGNAIEKSVLVLAANPLSTDRLELEREAGAIWTELHQGGYGDNYRVRIEQGHRLEDLARYLWEYQPTIVHFVGQGSATGEIMMKDGYDRTQPVPPEILARLFATVRQKIDCVVLNSCFSTAIAHASTVHVRCTIGIDEEVDDFSPTFLGEFYRELGAGKGYYQSFERGRTQIQSAFEPPQFITRDRTIFEDRTILPSSNRSSIEIGGKI
jgi:hypothetical protein